MNAWLPQASSTNPWGALSGRNSSYLKPLAGLHLAERLSARGDSPGRLRIAAVAFPEPDALPPGRLGRPDSPAPGTTERADPCGNFSGTSSLKFRGTKGSIGHTFMVCIHTENQNQGDFCPFALLEISVLHESPLGHLRYGLTDVPPQPNSPPDNVFNPDRPAKDLNARNWTVKSSSASLNK